MGRATISNKCIITLYSQSREELVYSTATCWNFWSKWMKRFPLYTTEFCSPPFISPNISTHVCCIGLWNWRHLLTSRSNTFLLFVTFPQLFRTERKRSNSKQWWMKMLLRRFGRIEVAGNKSNIEYHFILIHSVNTIFEFY